MSPLEFEVLTLFPEVILSFCQAGVLGKAIEAGRVHVHGTNVRDFSTDRHRTVDDTPFGGGAGMVMKIEPIVAALESIEAARGPMHRILLSPSAPRFDQRTAERLAKLSRIAIVCGRYEGIDDRVREHFVDECLSIGDYVLNGGEVAALVILEVVARLRAGVVGNPDSLEHDSHAADVAGTLLEHPHYTRPAEFRGLHVPPVLLSGNHADVARWRAEQARARTWELRPDLRSVPSLPMDVPLYLALDADAGVVPGDVWVELMRRHAVVGLLGVGKDVATWSRRWVEALGGRVAVTGFPDLVTVERQLRRSHRGQTALFAHNPALDPTGPAGSSAASLDRARAHLHAPHPAVVILWLGPTPPLAVHVQFALPPAPADLALQPAMIDSPQPWSTGAVALADGALAHVRRMWTRNELPP